MRKTADSNKNFMIADQEIFRDLAFQLENLVSKMGRMQPSTDHKVAKITSKIPRKPLTKHFDITTL